MPKITTTRTPDQIRDLLEQFDPSFRTMSNYHLAHHLARPVEDGGLGVSFDVARKWFERGGNPTVPLVTALALMKRLRAREAR